MPPLLFADNFLAGSILTLLMPALLLGAIAVWYHLEIRRVPKNTPVTSSSLPPADVLAAADDTMAPADEARTEPGPATPPTGGAGTTP